MTEPIDQQTNKQTNTHTHTQSDRELYREIEGTGSYDTSCCRSNDVAVSGSEARSAPDALETADVPATGIDFQNAASQRRPYALRCVAVFRFWCLRLGRAVCFVVDDFEALFPTSIYTSVCVCVWRARFSRRSGRVALGISFVGCLVTAGTASACFWQ